MRENGFQTKWAIPTDIYWRCHIDVKRVPTEDSTLDRALDSAISASWKELAQGSPIDAMQVEYRTGASGSLDYFKIWSSTLTGHGYLVCEELAGNGYCCDEDCDWAFGVTRATCRQTVIF